MLHIKKDDQVVIIAGKDKDKSGRVLSVDPRKDRVLIENINMVKKSQKKTQENPAGGFIDIEVPIHISNVQLLDKKANKPTRFGVKVLKDGSKVRISKKSGEVI
ncbi:MAG: large subunit ribosomal protein L24 [Candidatus Omnitrophota bacterium]|jgi:large subunit ribosomal protein L24